MSQFLVVVVVFLGLAAPQAKPAPEAGRKTVTVIPLKKLDGKATAEKLLKVLPESVTVAPVRGENAIIVYGTEASCGEVVRMLRLLGEDVPRPAANSTPEPKTYAVKFQNVPWKDALAWYGEISGLMFVGDTLPTGTLTLMPPARRQFTVGEITDLFNEALIAKKFILIRRQATFVLHPADEKIDPSFIPRIELSELSNRGKTELVQVLLPLKNLQAKDTAPEVQKMLTPFGIVAAIEKLNTLVLLDTAGNIKRIWDTIQEVERAAPVENVFFVYPCKWQRASDIIDQVRKLVDDRSLRLAEERSSNSVIVISGTAETIESVKKLLQRLDHPKNPGDKPVTLPEPELRKYSVPPGTAESVAKTLQTAYPSLKIVALPQSNEILVYATPEEHFAIVDKLRFISDGAEKKKE